ncbi:hypothetical protein OJAV_G00073560 [Oryzias javanicus]|uniref:Uncharacterized protein n=1 Tax=Oryzias javanicus TaxID=123683 RepID=A0A3S2Q3K9_ORYJA|nr:hypothetical protein OJAV_G00073560 [Oryzias javanicus]
MVKEGNICLTREDFWSLGLEQCMEFAIGNACLKIVGEAARRHENYRSKDILIFPSWSRQAGHADHYLLCAILVAEKEILFLDSLWPDGFGDDHYKTIFRRAAALIDPGSWTEKTGSNIEFFPQQFSGNDCGIFMLMYALCICTSSPLSFSQEEMPAIRRWWCIQLMERFSIDGHGQRLAFWTEEASHVLQGTLEPIFRIPKARRLPSPSPVIKIKDEADRCLLLKFPACVLSNILQEVVLMEGDPAILKLALVCSSFRDIVSAETFRRQAHFKWLHSVCTWSRYSKRHRELYFVMYSIEICCECGKQYKHCPRGYVGSGKRGHLRAFYSDEMPPGYCSHFCMQL